MSREEYMKLLAVALNDISPTEKEEALQYYNDYLDDAGVEKEQEVLKSLGSPAALAQSIRKDLGTEEKGVFGKENINPYQMPYSEPLAPKKKLSGGIIALIVVLSILASPFLLAIGSVVLAVIIAIFSVLLGVAAAIVAVIVTLICAGFSCLLAAAALGGVSPFSALLLVGISFLGIGICIFLLMALVWLFGKAIPGVVNGIVKLFQKIFRKKGGR